MTTLIITLWILYGLYSCVQFRDTVGNFYIEEMLLNKRGRVLIIIIIAFAPVVLTVKMIYGAFKRYDF